MKSLSDVIIRYETARLNVSKLSLKKSRLIGECEGIDTCEDNHGMIVEIGEPCGVVAWKYMTEEEDDDVSFEDAFLIYIYDEEGACDKCIEAYKLKHGELADARQEFGNAKRSLSYHGKKLINGRIT